MILILSTLFHECCLSQEFSRIEEFCISSFNPKKEDKITFLEIFGTPDNVERGFSEIEGEEYEDLIYSKSRFVFVHRYLNGFSIKDSLFSIEPYGLKVGVGSDKVQELFPLSWESRETSLIEGQVEEAYLWINVGDYFLFSINLSGGKVTSIASEGY